MTPRERAIEATREVGTPDWGSDDQEQLEMAVEQAINAAVEDATARLETENARMRAALRIFEDGANWERYPGLRDPVVYIWRHDSDPRVLAENACNNSATEISNT